MRKVIANSLLMLLPVASVFAQKAEETKAIDKLCGCFEIEFKYNETFPKDSSFKLSKPYKEHAVEWVEVVEKKPGKIALQHLLAIGDKMVIKHWREDWEFEKTSNLQFVAPNEWKKVSYKKEDVKNTWSQSVYEVDDAPRYFGFSQWIKNNGKYYWENTTDAPLPRREYSVRTDYNVLKRGNKIVLTDSGYVHEQDNIKIVREAGKPDNAISEEKGYNTYVKVDDSKCKIAKDWWNENKAFWNSVKQAWDLAIAETDYMKLKKVVDKKSLSKHFEDLKKAGVTDVNQIKATIKSFIGNEATASN